MQVRAPVSANGGMKPPGAQMLKTAFVAIVIAAGTLAEAQAQEDQLKSRLPSMTIGAIVNLEVVPDVAVLHLSVSTERKTTSAAAEETAGTSQAVLGEIKSQGLDPRDLKTSVSVSAVFDEQRGPQGQLLKRTLRGYVARNALTIRLRDVSRAGALARNLIDKGANVFDGIQFVVSEDERRMDELRVKATKDAVRKAKLYAEAAEVKLGRVLSIEPEASDGSGNAADLPRRAARPAGDVVTTVIPIEPGVQQLTARVSVTWEIVP